VKQLFDDLSVMPKKSSIANPGIEKAIPGLQCSVVGACSNAAAAAADADCIQWTVSALSTAVFVESLPLPLGRKYSLALLMLEEREHDTRR